MHIPYHIFITYLVYINHTFIIYMSNKKYKYIYQIIYFSGGIIIFKLGDMWFYNGERMGAWRIIGGGGLYGIKQPVKL